MFLKKLFLSLGALCVIGGSGAGVYYSLKEDNSGELVPPSSSGDVQGNGIVEAEVIHEAAKETLEVPDSVDDSASENLHLPSSGDGISGKASDSSKREEQNPVVINTIENPEESPPTERVVKREVISEEIDITKGQAEKDSISELQNSRERLEESPEEKEEEGTPPEAEKLLLIETENK